MKKKFTFLLAAVMLLMMMSLPGKAVGQTRDDELTISFKSTTNASSDGTSTIDYGERYFDAGYGYLTSGTLTRVYQARSGYGWKLGTNSVVGSIDLTVNSTVQEYTISKVSVNAHQYNSSNKTIKMTVTKDDNTTETKTWTSLTSSFENYELTLESPSQIKSIKVETTGTSSAYRVYVKNIVITTVPASTVATPKFSKGSSYCDESQSITITCNTEGATIHYTLDGTEPTSASTTYSGAISITETTTLRAVAIKDEESSTEASATYTFVSTLKTMEAIYAAATAAGSTATAVYIHFNNWVISGIQSGGSNYAYVTDGTYGCQIYGTGHGFVAGNKLNGIVPCNLKLLNGMSYITGLTASSSGLDVTSGGVVNPVVSTIGALSGINAGSVVTINDVTYYNSTTSLSDGTNTIKYSNQISSQTFTDGFKYDITGVFDMGSDQVKRINPRSAEDVVKGPATLPFSWAGGVKSDLLALQGVTAYGLGSGYTDTHGLYRVQFDDTGDYIMVRTDSQPDVVTIGVKKIGGAGNSTITVQGSSDGVTFDEGQALTISGNSNAIVNLTSTRSFGEDVRYVKLLFTKSANVGVGPISITKNAPTITVSESSISGFNYVFGHGPSTSQNFTVSGIHLNANLVVTASSHYEVCKTADGTYESSISYEPTSGSVAASTVYVRLKAGLSAGSYATADDKITVSSTGADDKTVSLSGSVAPVFALTSTVSPAGSGTVTFGASSLAEGESTTATAAANAGYKFTGWSISGTGATLSNPSTNPTTVTMGTAAATVTATFTPVTTHPIHWSVNGAVVKTDNVEENTDITFAAPASGVPTGFVFQGWSETTISGSQSTAPTYVSSATANAEKTYYAVMALVGDSSTETATLTANSSWSSYDDKQFTDDKGKTWTANCTGQNLSGTYYYGLNTGNGSYVQSPVFSGSITAISVNARNNAGSVRSFYIKSTKAGTSGDLGSISVPANASGVDINATLESTSFSSFYLGVSAALQFHSIAVTYNVITYSNYCTSVSDVTENEDIDENGELTDDVTYNSGIYYLSETITVPDGYTLTVGGTAVLVNTDAANLIIEDGGQLIVNNSGVQATVKKDISSWGSKGVGGWNFIASPINSETLKPSEVGNMLTNETEAPYSYDLYRYNDQAENSLGWENYHAHNTVADPFYLVNGMGYLYANASGVNLEFSGEVRPSNTTVEVTGLKATYNLVGNPFTCNAYLNTDYYRLVGGNRIEATKTTPSIDNFIAPNTGVIVESTNGGTVKFSKDFPVASANSGDLQMVLAQNVTTRGESSSRTLDNAIVSFNEGSQLGKFYFGTQDANLYIPMDNEEYAIVSSSAQGEMPVNFRAYVTGEYTITVNPEEVEMGYLHLIDNIAGVDVDLLANPSYTFNARYDDYESRFRLVFSANMVNSDLNDDFAFFSNGQLVIANEGEAILQVIDVNGRIVATESINGTCSKAINAKAGVYVLRLINGTDVKTQKIIVK